MIFATEAARRKGPRPPLPPNSPARARLTRIQLHRSRANGGAQPPSSCKSPDDLPDLSDPFDGSIAIPKVLDTCHPETLVSYTSAASSKRWLT
jgi:hypothetical protein